MARVGRLAVDRIGWTAVGVERVELARCRRARRVCVRRTDIRTRLLTFHRGMLERHRRRVAGRDAVRPNPERVLGIAQADAALDETAERVAVQFLHRASRVRRVDKLDEHDRTVRFRPELQPLIAGTPRESVAKTYTRWRKESTNGSAIRALEQEEGGTYCLRGAKR